MKSILSLASIGLVSSFTILTPISTKITPTSSPSSFPSNTLLKSSNIDDDISAQLAKARALLEKAKAKVEIEESKQEQEDSESESAVVAESDTEVEVQAEETPDDKVKSRDEETGLITADGEVMAALSEEEDWEMRDLLQMFESEIKEDSDVSKQLADRDVAASIFNLRMSMHNGDYRTIFNKRNRFIGEDN